MFDKLKNYMAQRFHLVEINEKPLSILQGYPMGYHKYALKNVSKETKEKFLQICDSNNLKWNIETKTFIGHNKALEKKQEKVIRAYLLANTHVQPTIIEQYCNLLKNLNGIGMQGIGIFGIDNTSDVSLQMLKNNLDPSRPFCMQNSLMIGSYFSNPVGLCADGSVLVFDGTALKNESKHLKNTIEYLEFQGFNDEQKKQKLLKANAGLKQFLESDIPTLAYWQNVETFITDEVIRLTELFLENPYTIVPIEAMVCNARPKP